jgi:hypothetical protein
VLEQFLLIMHTNHERLKAATLAQLIAYLLAFEEHLPLSKGGPHESDEDDRRWRQDDGRGRNAAADIAGRPRAPTDPRSSITE